MAIVEDVEKTCKNIAILNEGRLLYTGTLSAFTAQTGDLESAYIQLMGGHAV